MSDDQHGGHRWMDELAMDGWVLSLTQQLLDIPLTAIA
jgi:hypothetical protein